MAKVRLNGDSSGFIELAAPNAAGSNTLTLPTSNGSANQLLKNSGTAGALAWSTLTEDSSGNLNVDSGTLFVDATNNRVGIGTTSPGTALDVSGAISLSNVALPSAGTARIFSRNTDSNLYIQTGSGSTINLLDASQNTMAIFEPTSVRFQISNSEKARLDSSGRFLVGLSSSVDGNALQIFNNVTSFRFADNSGSSGFACTHSRNTTAGLHTIVQNGDQLGFISFRGSDGTQFLDGAFILASVDGTPGVNDMPGRLSFHTTSDGASSATERMRITSAGYLKATSDGTYNDSTGLQHELTQSTSGTDVLILRSKNASLAAGTLEVSVSRANNSAYNFFRGWSSGFSDLEFNLRGDGNAFADGTWTGGGADYAEYFEWTDSNLDEEDRRGISVVLDGDKIREAVTGEDPIGVISSNPSVVGDAAWNKWSGKYLRDEFGTYIQEDYEVVNDEGETVVQQRRKLNPAYDPDAEYIPREQRPEWDCVGLMGKLRIRKGQVIGSRWIKMRDISDTVEEWLVR